MNTYRSKGKRFFEQCFEEGHVVKLFTVIRHPLERAISAMNYFAKSREKATVVRHVMRNPLEVTDKDVREAVLRVENISFPGGCGVHQAMDVLLDQTAIQEHPKLQWSEAEE